MGTGESRSIHNYIEFTEDDLERPLSEPEKMPAGFAKGASQKWLLTSHVRRYHRHYDSSGHVWQGQFKAFPIQQDEHLLTVLRYVERNPVRAKSLPIRKAERWPWSSLGTPPKKVDKPLLDLGPVRRPDNWLNWVNEPETEAELNALRDCVAGGAPYGSERWQQQAARRLGLESTLRPRGRPRKKLKK